MVVNGCAKGIPLGIADGQLSIAWMHQHAVKPPKLSTHNP